MIHSIPQAKRFRDLGAVVPYRAICEDVLVSQNPDRLTAVLQLHVSSINDTGIMQQAHDRLMHLLCELPPATIASLYFCKTFSEEKIPVLGRHPNAVVNYIEQKRVAHLTKIKAPTYIAFLAITMPLAGGVKPEFGLVAKLLQQNETLSEADAFRKTLEKLNHSLKGLMGAFTGMGNLFRLKTEDLYEFLSVLINHDYCGSHTQLSDVFTSDFISSNRGAFSKKPAYVFYGGSFHSVLSLRSVGGDSRLPESSDANLNTIFLHKDLQHIPFTIHQAIHFPGKEDGLARATLRKNMITARGTLASYLPFLAKTPEGIEPAVLRKLIEEAIQHVRESSDRFLEQHFHVHLWAPSLEELNDRVQAFDAAVGSTYKLKRDKLNLKAAYYSMFPGNEALNPIRSLLPSFNVSDFMPIDLPRYCYPDKARDFVHYHSMTDSLVRLSLFDKRADNWNALIVGGSGSGKSFLAQDLLWQYQVYNPQIAIVDYGGAEAGSYRSFVLNNQGTYLEIGLGGNAVEFSINPFDGPLFDDRGRPIAGKLTSLLTILEIMVSTQKGDRLNNVVLFELQNALKAYYSAHGNNADNSCSLTEFAFTRLRDNKAVLSAGRDLFKELFFFIGEAREEGPYARFFRATKQFTTTDVICFDLEGLKGHERLKNVLVVALLDMITNRILASAAKERRKLLFMDEAWKDLKGGDMADFMENCSRTVRKLNGQITVISQRLSDILESPIGGALLANTSYYYFVGNKHEHSPDTGDAPLRRVSASSSQGTVRLSDYDIETILDSQSKRDFYLLTPFFSGQLRFYPSKEFCMVATTDPEDKQILRRHMDRLGHAYVTPQVMEAAKGDFFRR